MYKFEQTVLTQNRLLPKERSDQGLYCLLYHLHLLEAFCFERWLNHLNFRFLIRVRSSSYSPIDAVLHCKTKQFPFRKIVVTNLGIPVFIRIL